MERATWNDLFADLSKCAVKGDPEGLRSRLWTSAAEIYSYLRTFQLDNAPDSVTEQYWMTRSPDSCGL